MTTQSEQWEWVNSQLIGMIQRDWPERYQEVYRKSDTSESKPRRAKGPPVVRERVTGTCGLRMGR